MNENRGPWYLLTGLLIGLVMGVLYTWVIRPVSYTNTTPASLRSDFKDKYRALIASAYTANGDLVRARARLELLKDSDIYRALAEQAQRTLADGSSADEARALGLLAVAIGQENTAGQVPGPGITATRPVNTLPSHTDEPAESTEPTASEFEATSTLFSEATSTESLTVEASPTAPMTISPTPTATITPIPNPTNTPLPTRTSTPTPGASFVLNNREQVCDQSLGEPLLQVQTLDAAGQQMPGVEIIVTWERGEEHFFTGLKPELGLGYADFGMSPDVIYTLRLAEGGQPVQDLSALECETAGGERYWGAWRLIFIQP